VLTAESTSTDIPLLYRFVIPLQKFFGMWVRLCMTIYPAGRAAPQLKTWAVGWVILRSEGEDSL